MESERKTKKIKKTPEKSDNTIFGSAPKCANDPSNDLPTNKLSEDEGTYTDVSDRSPDPNERCSTPVPEAEDAWQEVLPEGGQEVLPDGGADLIVDVSLPTGEKEPADGSPPPNTRPSLKESSQNAPASKVRGLSGMALAILNDYYEKGPNACKKPQWNDFYNYFPNAISNQEKCVPKTRNHLEDLIKFIDPDVLEPQEHYGYRVLSDSVWLSDPTSFDSGEKKSPDLIQFSENSNTANVEQGKRESLLELRKNSANQKTAKNRISFHDNVAQLTLTEVPRGVGTPEAQGSNPVLPNSPTKCLDLGPVEPDGSQPSRTTAPQANDSESDETSAPDVAETVRTPEFDEWGEELDYD